MAPRVSSVATPGSLSPSRPTLTDQMEPLIPTAMADPSGDHAGAQGVELGAGGR